MFAEALGKDPVSVQMVGAGSAHGADPLRDADQRGDRTASHRAVRRIPAEGLRRPAQQAGDQRSAVSETWGGQITQKALIALVVFLVLAAIYITVRYERYMAIAALSTLFFDSSPPPACTRSSGSRSRRRPSSAC